MRSTTKKTDKPLVKINSFLARTFVINTIITALVLSSCDSKKEQEEIFKTDIAAFRQLFLLDSLSPVEVKWIHGTMGTPSRMAIGPEDYYVVAIIKLPQNEFDTLTQHYQNQEDISSRIHLEKSVIRDWFSDAVKRRFLMEDKYVRIKGPVYEAVTFKGFYSSRFCFFTDENEIFLSSQSN